MVSWKVRLGLERRDDNRGTAFVTPTSAAETESFQRMERGEERNIGGDSSGGIAFSVVDRLEDQNAVFRHGDARAVQIDVESIDALQRRFPEAFSEADKVVRSKKESSKPFFYDYEADRRYKEWENDQRLVRERLKVHWLDDFIDHPLEATIYLGRIFTTAGLFYGIGRTAYLYRTMDKTYARLHGLTLSSIALGEVSVAVCKGAAVALGGTAGVIAGETCMSLGCTLVNQDLTLPERGWHHIVSCGIGAGVGTGAVFAGLHYKQLTRWGMGATLLAFTSVFAVVGSYLGYAVYRPFAAKREHRLYDPYWRPWSERMIGYGGPHHVRGRYT